MSDLFPPQGGYDSVNGDKEHVGGSQFNPDDMLLLVTANLGKTMEWMAARGLVKRQCYIANTNTARRMNLVGVPPEHVVFFEGWMTGRWAMDVKLAVETMVTRQGRKLEECMAVG